MVNNWATSRLITGPRHFYTIKIGVSGDFWVLSYQFVFFFCFQLFANFLKIAFFKKRVQKLGFSIFCVLSLNFENSHFLGLQKHYKNRGFSRFLCFLFLKEKKIGQKKMITGIYKFWVFWSKNGRFVTHNWFSKKRP